MCMITAAIVGGILNTAAQQRQIESQEAQAEYYAQREAENARLARREAEAIGVMAQQEEEQLYRKMKSQQAAARTGYAASGVLLGSGTANDYEADIADAYDLESRNLQYDIASRKWQKQVQATNASDQSAMYRSQADYLNSTKGPSLLSGMFSTIGGAASAAMGYSKLFI